MTENPVKQKWAREQPTFGAWLSIPSSLVAEGVASLGFDYVCIDLQHGMIDYPIATEMLMAIAGAGAVPFARVPANDFAAINRVLDAGALGVIVPMIYSQEDARAAVRACRYPPLGRRSYGPTRAAIAAGPSYFENADGLVACVPMIETVEALDDLDAILSVDGIDAIYVGPNDLSLALGQPPAADNPAPYQDAYVRIAAACQKAGVPAGIHAKAALAAKHLATGFRMITVSSDFGALLSGANADLEKSRAAD